MNENNVIELWIVGSEYVMIMVVYEYLVYKVSLGYVALAPVRCLPCRYVALRGGVKGKSRVRGYSTCVLLPCGYVALRAMLKVSLGYVALALVYCCPAGMWLCGRC
jgi:hypothetical protein